MDRGEHPFYDVEIFREGEQQYIRKLLKRYQGRPVNEELKKEVWELLMQEKHLGRIKIPFKVALKPGGGKYPDALEVLLDTKV